MELGPQPPIIPAAGPQGAMGNVFQLQQAASPEEPPPAPPNTEDETNDESDSEAEETRMMKKSPTNQNKISKIKINQISKSIFVIIFLLSIKFFKVSVKVIKKHQRNAS